MNKFQLLILAIAILGSCEPVGETKDLQVLTIPFNINNRDVKFTGTEHLLLVPENRAAKESRTITIHYYHLKAKNTSDLSPVFYLPGGPGDKFDEGSFFIKNGTERREDKIYEIEKLNEYRDVLILNQRGNSRSPAFGIKDFTFELRTKKNATPTQDSIAFSEAFKKAITLYKDQKIDVAGYDFMNHIEDINDVRRAIGAEKIMLYGNSFGSQSSIGYIQKYPAYVDRAMLSGIEPIDYGYDDPADIWKVFERIEADASQLPDFKDKLPKIGLIEAYKEVVDRLKKKPLKYHLSIPQLRISDTILITANDVKENVWLPFADGRQEKLKTWPKYISELYNSNYDMLALYLYQQEDEQVSKIPMITLFIDNSIGISKSRDKLISNREELDYIVDPNLIYRYTEAVNPTPEISNSFRELNKWEIPLLIIQGNMDWSTPHENALFVKDHFSNSHILSLNRGTHASKKELIMENPELADELYRFTVTKKPIEFLENLPEVYTLSEFEYVSIEGKSILELVLESD